MQEVEWSNVSEDYDGLSDYSCLKVLPGNRVRATCNGVSHEYQLAGEPVKCEDLDDNLPVCAEDPVVVDDCCRRAFGVGLTASELG